MTCRNLMKNSRWKKKKKAPCVFCATEKFNKNVNFLKEAFKDQILKTTD